MKSEKFKSYMNIKIRNYAISNYQNCEIKLIQQYRTTNGTTAKLQNFKVMKLNNKEVQ